MRKATTYVFLLALLLPAVAVAQTGKISGRVTDAGNGEALPGVNVIIDGSTQGGVTDLDGYYNIINVRPGEYSVRASFVGYNTRLTEGVRVNTNLTSTVNFLMQEDQVGLEEVVVTAERPIVQRDISANIATLTADEIENLPVSGVSEVINLQAGIDSGLSIRGGGRDEIAFLVDGMSTAGGRTTEPFMNVSFTSVDEVQIQTGGFNAEYGNLRSGLINLVTKEGSRTQYTVDAVMRYSPPTKKYFGPQPGNEESYFMRPFVDPDVAFVGTHTEDSGWDQYTREFYPQWEGYNAFADRLAGDDDPANDLSPQELQQLMMWRLRQDFEPDTPDFEVDATIGGPVPGGQKLGNLRFLASYRQTQRAYVVPQQRKGYEGYTGQFKLTSDVGTGMKFVLNGMFAQELGMNTSNQAWTSSFDRGESPDYPWDNRSDLMALISNGDHVFKNNNYTLSDIDRFHIGAEFTHAVNQNTFYEVRFQRQETEYFTRPGPARVQDNIISTIAGIPVDDAPLSWDPQPGGQGDIYLGGNLLGGGGRGRDTSDVVRYMAQFDITSQVNRFMQVKAGLSYDYGDYNVNHGDQDSFHVHHANPKFKWNRQPHVGGGYAQTKLEFQGMVANLGVRLDYFHAGGEWVSYDAYSRAFTAKFGAANLEENLPTEPTDRQFFVSPRVGVSFPITVNSKLYFNYGHFRQILDPLSLFLVRSEFFTQTAALGNPNHPMPRTVAYEVGYEHNLFDQFLVRVAGFYRDVSNQPRNVNYLSIDNLVDYDVAFPYNYEDNRGFEITLSKNRGRWVRGFLNYTFLVRKEGNFAYNQQKENRVEQRIFEENARNTLFRPQPEPFARANVEFLTPQDFGPQSGNFRPLADWRLSFLTQWRSGDTFTYAGAGGAEIPGIRDNMKWKDYWNLDMRISKNFQVGSGRAQIFADINNVLNIKRLQRFGALAGSFNFERYMESLHLERDAFSELGDEELPSYLIPGSDQPGDFRDSGVEYVPIEPFPSLDRVVNANERALYYIRDEAGGGTYYQYNGSDFVEADEAKVSQVMDDKAYIYNPIVDSFRFLNPRNVYFGVRFTF
ncbi:MAG: carboxypeptidase-like regulatory domain-containing protein [Rhodothermales bacterium]